MRRFVAWLTAGLGVALTGGTVAFLDSQEEQRIRAEIAHRADVCRSLLETRLSRQREAILTLRNLFRVFGDMGEARFVAFAEDVRSRCPGLEAVAWVTCGSSSPQADSGSTIAANQGTAATSPTALPPGVQLPLRYLSPATDDRWWKGRDMAADPTLTRLLTGAVSENRVSVGEPEVLQNASNRLTRVYVAAPILPQGTRTDPIGPQKAPPAGFLICRVSLGRTVEETLAFARPSGVDLLLVDETVGQPKRVLHFSPSDPRHKTPAAEERTGLPDSASNVFTLSVGGRLWQGYCRASADWRQAQRTYYGYAVLLGGLLLTGIVTSHLRCTVRRTEEVEALVDSRTAQITSIRQELEKDIERRKAAEAGLRQSQEDLAEAQAISKVGSWRWNWHTGVLTASDELLRIYGLPRRETYQMDDFLAFNSPEDRCQIQQILAEAQATGVVRSIDYKVSLSGEQRVLRAAARIMRGPSSQHVGLIGTVQDLTEMRQAEDQLRRKQADHLMLFNSVPVFIWYKDTFGRIIKVNRAAARAIGKPVEAIEGRTDAELFPEDAACFREDDAEVLASNRPKRGIVERLPTATGERLWIETDKVPMHDDQGKVMGLLVISHDLSERKRTTDAIQQRNRELRALNSVATALSGTLETEEVLRQTCRAFTEAAGVAAGSVFLYGLDRKDLILATEWGLEGEVVERLRQTSVAEQLHQLLLDAPHAEALPVGGTGPSQTSAISLRHPHWGAGICLPLVSKVSTLGAILLWNEPPQPFPADRLNFCRILANAVALAAQNAQLFEELRLSNRRQRDLSLQLIETQERERRFIARELHDQVGQLLTGLQLTLAGYARKDLPALHASLKTADGLVCDLIQQVRNLSFELRPSALDDLGLVPALKRLFDQFSHMTKIQVSFAHSGVTDRLPPSIETATFRIVQEALTNAARHARVSLVAVRLWLENQRLRIQIEDQGIGFHPGQALKTTTSSGLAGMQERVSLLNGCISFISQPGTGTRVTAELPLPCDWAGEIDHDKHRNC